MYEALICPWLKQRAAMVFIYLYTDKWKQGKKMDFALPISKHCLKKLWSDLFDQTFKDILYRMR